MAELFRNAGPIPRSQWGDLPDVPVDHLDYKYVRECNNVVKLKDIVRVLQSGKEGLYPDLERCARERLLELMPERWVRRLFYDLSLPSLLLSFRHVATPCQRSPLSCV